MIQYNIISFLLSFKYYLLLTIIFFFLSFLINKSNLSIKHILGFFLSLIVIYLINSQRNKFIKINNYEFENIFKEIPILKKLENHKELVLFYYNARELANYDYLNYKDSLLNTITLINLFEQISHSNYLIKYQYEIFKKHMNLSINYFKKIEFGIIHNDILINLLKNNTKQLIEILNNFENIIIKKNNSDIEINGYNINKGMIFKNL